MKIKNVNELNLEQLAKISGGYHSDALCTCECECTCTGNQKDNSIDRQAKNTVNSVTKQMKNR